MCRRRTKCPQIDHPAGRMTPSQYHDWYWTSGAALVDTGGINPIDVIPGDSVTITCVDHSGRVERARIEIIDDPTGDRYAPVEEKVSV